jgi:putative N6-adenine-specific DNA methylase
MKELFVTTSSGLEMLLSEELQRLGIAPVRRGHCGVYVPKEMKHVYRINYCSRLATRVLWPLISFTCKDAKTLYDGACHIDWERYIQPHQTFAIDSHVNHPLLRNSLHAAQVVKDALCDILREKYGTRPSVDKTNPHVSFHLFIDNGRATISFDTSGAPLYKRGLRTQSTVAPIQESLAAALLYVTHYSAEKIFCDPFCGSGTFLMEAAMMATHTPAGYFRNDWGMLHFPEFSETHWNKAKEEANQKIVPLEPGKIFGADRDPKAVAACTENLKATPFSNIVVQANEIKRYTPPAAPNFVLCNPPYGKRLDLSTETYGQLGCFLKEKTTAKNSAFFLSPFDQVFIPGFHLKKHFSLFSGGSKVHLCRFD